MSNLNPNATISTWLYAHMHAFAYTHILSRERSPCTNWTNVSFRSYSSTRVSRNALLPVFTTETKRPLGIERKLAIQ